MSTHRDAELAGSLAAVRTRLARAAEAAGRDVRGIELLPVTKFFPASDVVILRRLGCSDFGESREQEAARKVADVAAQFPGEQIRWHMVGHVQRNKARAIARWAHTVHSVDSARVIAALGGGAEQALADGHRSTPLRVYLQLSLDGDPDRGGVAVGTPDLIDELCAAIHAIDALELAGVMGIPPLDWDAEDAFVRLAAERDRVQRSYRQPLGLSAGMSGDMEIAVRHGSTCVRVGTALMGQRPLTSP
ncbi:YggS family pyridoxal phosphate-dependent enzyme [Mycolicibacterium bacteremicum]|uniref:Pyridoxal phosphate homeostasis protein n=1 Tax=Mycolicibacterium bacteremicum TaxID=564198 RepID=A0A1W9Z1J1_MYCBA|nr:YggS family pyridoxal phosphate-dependent enzyme [Mycolicibacterium bacteremicum]MCV7433017.1 YggS family pyridoxal phosphate-dependent enzyme [Mycolicibacterium bacteremicum]ORA06188.1 YggS family pyridoxal phosphate enzyme [Mycolicibacterium bacteremicum]